MDRRETLAYLAESIRGAWTKPFRGQIHEYAGKLNLQGGYAVKGLLQMVTLRHLLEPLEALRDPAVHLVSVRGAVQTTKSLLADIFVPYVIEHDPGDVLWLLEDDAKAKEYADRCMGLIKSIPEIAKMLEGVDHHDKTKTIIRFKHMKLVICGLNPGNVQSLSWRYVIIDETWLHPFDGLLRQAMDRTKQYPNTKKILVLSQGGWEEDDHDRVHKETDQRELHYACPQCGWHQPFELSIERMPIGGQPVLKPEIKYAGLAWDSNEVTKPNGRWNAELASLTAHHVCFRCAARLPDTDEMRNQLALTYRYIPAGADPNFDTTRRFPFPSQVGFHWPAEASTRLPWRDQVKKYIPAKTSADEQAYRLPLQEFYQKDRGLPWSEAIAQEQKVVIHEPYDVKLAWPEESFRPLIVDCQRDLKKFFFHVYAVSRAGEARMLDRGSLDSFDAIAEKQKQWGVKDQQVFLDVGYEMTKALRECVKHGHVQVIRGGRMKVWACWTGLKGSGQEIFRHERKAKKGKNYDWRIYSKCDYYNVNIGTNDRHPRAPWYSWSNLHCKDLLRARRDQDENCPKLKVLPDTLPTTDPWSYHQQMRSEYRKEEYRDGRKVSIWKLIKEGRPNHDWDISSMLMAFMAIVGIIGAPEPPPDSEKAG